MLSGIFKGKAVLEGARKFELKKIVKDGKPVLKVSGNMIVTEGPNAGQTSSYDGKFDERSIRFTRRDLIALGWQGVTTKTLIDDITKAAKVVSFETEIATYNGRSWSAVRSIGYEPQPTEALTDDDFAKLDGWFGEVDARGNPAPLGNSGLLRRTTSRSNRQRR
jgi:hypothetical protein